MAAKESQSARRAFDGAVKHQLPTPKLESARFVMRPLVREDAEALFPTLSDPALSRYLIDAEFETVDALGDWLCDPDWNGRSWSAIDRSSGENVGRIVAVPAGKGTIEVGYVTVKHRHGEGIAEECTRRLLEYLFEEEKIHRAIAGTDPRNIASNRVLEKLGFRREAHYLESCHTHLGWCDEYFWGMLAREWRAARN